MSVKIHTVFTDILYTFTHFVGFYTAHMIWSLDVGGNIVPLLAVKQAEKSWLNRFTGDSYEQAVKKARELFQTVSLDKGDQVLMAYDGYLIREEKRDESLFISAFGNQAPEEDLHCWLTIPYHRAPEPQDLMIEQANLYLPKGLFNLDLFIHQFKQGVYSHTKGIEFWNDHKEDQLDLMQITELSLESIKRVR